MTPEEIAKQRQEAESKKISAIQPADNMTSQAVVLDKPSSVQTIEKVYESPINQLGLTIKGLEGRRNYIQQQDEIAQRRSRNMQMIAGLSDGLASLANLIGVADRGSNINLGQGALTPLGQKVEQARLERKADIKSIDDRLEQANNQLMQMKLARGNAVAQAQQREKEAAQARLEKLDERKFQEKLLGIRLKAEAEQKKKDQEFTAGENEKNRSLQERMNNADNAAVEKRYEAELAAKMVKEAAKPETQRRILNENIVGIRDELAKKMGYADYNEYLRYQNVEGWGKEIDGQRDRKSKKIRKERAMDNPEAQELINMLKDPTTLEDSSIQMLIGASKTFADAINAASGKDNGNDEDDDFSAYKVTKS